MDTKKTHFGADYIDIDAGFVKQYEKNENSIYNLCGLKSDCCGTDADSFHVLQQNKIQDTGTPEISYGAIETDTVKIDEA